MDPLAKLTLDEQLDLRAALTEVIEGHMKAFVDSGGRGVEEAEQIDRWQALAERIDEHSDRGDK